MSSRIGQYDRFPDPFFLERDSTAANVSDKALKSVAFIGVREDGRFQPRAIALFVQWVEEQHRFAHLVTAENVVSRLLSKNQEIWLRVDLVGGGTGEVKLDPRAFCFHPKSEEMPTDVAVCPMGHTLTGEKDGEPVEADIAFLELSNGGYPPTGVGVPVDKVIETIQHPDLVAMRKDIIQDLRESGATPDRDKHLCWSTTT